MSWLSRRDFVKLSSSTAAGVAALGMFGGGIRLYGNARRVALLGTGRFGREMLRAMEQTGRSVTVACCDEDPKKLKALAEANTNRSPARYTDYREMLVREWPDIVIVATPDGRHIGPVKACVKAGIHVLLAPPVCRTLAELNALTAAAEKSLGIIQVAYESRFQPAWQRLKALVGDDRLGAIKEADLRVETPGINVDSKAGPRFLKESNGPIGFPGEAMLDLTLECLPAAGMGDVFSVGAQARADANGRQAGMPVEQFTRVNFGSAVVSWRHKAGSGDASANIVLRGENGQVSVNWFQNRWSATSEDGTRRSWKDEAPGPTWLDNACADLLDAMDRKKRPAGDLLAVAGAARAGIYAIAAMRLRQTLRASLPDRRLLEMLARFPDQRSVDVA